MSLLAGATIAGIGALGNMGGSAMSSALGYYASRAMTKYNYDLQKRGYKEFPSAQVQGLRAAGINPMVAYGGMAGATAHAGNYSAAQGSNLGSSAMADFREGSKLNPTVQNIKADTSMKGKQGDSALMQGQAAIQNAQSQATVANAQAAFYNAQARKIGTETPGETDWGTLNRILSNVGSVGTVLGGSALAAKGIKDMVTKKPSVLDTSSKVFKAPAKINPKIKLPVGKTPVSTLGMSSAKAVGKTLGKLATKASIAAAPFTSSTTMGDSTVEGNKERWKKLKKEQDKYKNRSTRMRIFTR